METPKPIDILTCLIAIIPPTNTLVALALKLHGYIAGSIYLLWGIIMICIITVRKLKERCSHSKPNMTTISNFCMISGSLGNYEPN
jgi:uncharacterized membrane protein